MQSHRRVQHGRISGKWCVVHALKLRVVCLLRCWRQRAGAGLDDACTSRLLERANFVVEWVEFLQFTVGDPGFKSLSGDRYHAASSPKYLYRLWMAPGTGGYSPRGIAARGLNLTAHSRPVHSPICLLGTSRQVAGSIPDGVMGVFHWQSFRPHYGPGVDSASNRNEYQEYFLGDKGGQCVGLTTLKPSRADCLEIWEPQPPGALRACPGL
jgi:hypothetical protein